MTAEWLDLKNKNMDLIGFKKLGVCGIRNLFQKPNRAVPNYFWNSGIPNFAGISEEFEIPTFFRNFYIFFFF